MHPDHRAAHRTGAAAGADTLTGRWRLIAAEDIRADGSVARYPWGRHPVGSIVVEGGWCYLQIMSGDTPSVAADRAVGDRGRHRRGR